MHHGVGVDPLRQLRLDQGPSLFFSILNNERRHEKPTFCISETKTQISFAVTAELISALVFTT